MIVQMMLICGQTEGKAVELSTAQSDMLNSYIADDFVEIGLEGQVQQLCLVCRGEEGCVELSSSLKLLKSPELFNNFDALGPGGLSIGDVRLAMLGLIAKHIETLGIDQVVLREGIAQAKKDVVRLPNHCLRFGQLPAADQTGQRQQREVRSGINPRVTSVSPLQNILSLQSGLFPLAYAGFHLGDDEGEFSLNEMQAVSELHRPF